MSIERDKGGPIGPWYARGANEERALVIAYLCKLAEQTEAHSRSGAAALTGAANTIERGLHIPPAVENRRGQR
jgi:hypothetical protein